MNVKIESAILERALKTGAGTEASNAWAESLRILLDNATSAMFVFQEEGEVDVEFTLDIFEGEDDGAITISFFVDEKCEIQAQGRSLVTAGWNWSVAARPKWYYRNYVRSAEFFCTYRKPTGYAEGPFDTKASALLSLSGKIAVQ